MRIKVRVKHYPATPPEFYSFEGENGAYSMTGDGSGRKWTASELLERFDVQDRDDLYLLAKEARHELDIEPDMIDADVVRFCRVELAPEKIGLQELAKMEAQKAPDVIPAPEPAPEPSPPVVEEPAPVAPEPEPEPLPEPAPEPSPPVVEEPAPVAPEPEPEPLPEAASTEPAPEEVIP